MNCKYYHTDYLHGTFEEIGENTDQKNYKYRHVDERMYFIGKRPFIIYIKLTQITKGLRFLIDSIIVFDITAIVN